MTISNIIFDWDGTLAKTLDLWLEGYQVSFNRRAHDFGPGEIVREFFHNHKDVPVRYPDMDFPVIAEETRQYVGRGLSTVDLYDGAKETLAALRGTDVSMSLVTSSARHLLETGLNAHGLADGFATNLAGDDGYGHKPSTRPFEETLDRLGAAASETLIIGDSHVDIEAGKAIGCRTCWFAPQQNQIFHDFEQIRGMGADHEIRDMRGLLELV